MAEQEISAEFGGALCDLKLQGFKVYEVSPELYKDMRTSPSRHSRRDFFKIALGTGAMTLEYGDRSFDMNGTFLYCGNPNVPQAFINRTPPTGHACLFTEAFISNGTRTESLQHSPLFRYGAVPVIPVTEEQAGFIRGLYLKMMTIQAAEYDYKDEMLRSCVELIIHEALRIQPAQDSPVHQNAASRITNLFMELLERQFPIENSSQPLKLRTAQDFAAGLSVHVNYLNRSVKEMTGKPTSVHIAERIVTEAKALLQHTDWSISDIAYGLGFGYPTYFNNYFKRVTGTTPNSIRLAKV